MEDSGANASSLKVDRSQTFDQREKVDGHKDARKCDFRKGRGGEHGEEGFFDVDGEDGPRESRHDTKAPQPRHAFRLDEEKGEGRHVLLATRR